MKLTAPESTSISHSLFMPSRDMEPTGSSALMPLMPYARTPMNAPTAIPILLISVCIAKHMPSARSPVFHSRYSTVSPIMA